jgi:hypothetical protein
LNNRAIAALSDQTEKEARAASSKAEAAPAFMRSESLVALVLVFIMIVII